MIDIVALIIARGGSKRIPKKNIKKLAGKPLIAWTIETAISSGAFTRVIVSTDDTEIMAASIEYGAEVPKLRPSHLSTDESLSIDAVLHAIDCLKQENCCPSSLMLLQPTSPLRSVGSIWSAIDLFERNNFQPVVSFTQVNFTPEWCFRYLESELTPILGWDSSKQRSQNIKPTLQLNGLLYLATISHLIQEQTFLGPSTVPLVCGNYQEVIDIDTYEDFARAEQLLMSNTP